MKPRNTQQGASASAGKTSSPRAARGASSSATRTRTGSSRAAREKTGAAARPATRPGKKAPSRRDHSSHRWWLLPLVVLGVAGLFIGAYYPVARVEYRETREKSALQAELGAIQARNARLRTEVSRLKTPEGVEDYARVRLGMVRKGEHVVVVVDGTEPAQSVIASGPPEIDSQEAAKPPVGPWTAFLDAFFGVQ